MSSEEEDYMSDAFLTKCIKDTRPGLIKNRVKLREMEITAKKAKIDEERKKQSKPNERERLKEGLSNAISSNNKGFALLAKMGYKQGESLGKSSKGITEPIGIQIKSDRGGLGREAAIKELEQKRQEILRKRLLQKANVAEVSTEEFRKRMTKKAEERFVESAIGKCQRACEKLDQENKVESPPFPWFWPDRKTKTAEDDQEESNQEVEETEDEEEIVYEPMEKLEMLLSYLRISYNYCHWCGVHYNDAEDMEKNCPGLEKDDH